MHGEALEQTSTASDSTLYRLHILQKINRPRVIAVGLFTVLAMVAACSNESLGTPTLGPQRTVVSTSTPISDEIAKARVNEIFETQIDAIKRSDWEAVFATCSPNFRAARDLERFVLDAERQFARDGYTAAGFEARNVEPFVRTADRIRVRWDAYENGDYVRTEEIGQIFVFTQGKWFDDGAWCK